MGVSLGLFPRIIYEITSGILLGFSPEDSTPITSRVRSLIPPGISSMISPGILVFFSGISSETHTEILLGVSFGFFQEFLLEMYPEILLIIAGISYRNFYQDTFKDFFRNALTESFQYWSMIFYRNHGLFLSFHLGFYQEFLLETIQKSLWDSLRDYF